MAWTVAKVGKSRPQERGGHAMAWVDSLACALVLGGTARDQTSFNEVWKLKLVQDTFMWSKMVCRLPEVSPSSCCSSPPANLVAKRIHATATVIGSRLFMIGGYAPDTGIVYNDVAVLDVDRSQWSWPPVGGEIPEPFHSHSATLLPGRRILIFGGKIGHDHATNAIFILETDTMIWHKPKTTGTPPSAREMHSAVAVKPTRLLIYGGKDATGVLADAIFFDAEDMHWEEKVVTTGVKSVGHTAVVTPDGQVLVYGGFSGEQVEGHLLRITESADVEVLSDAMSAATARRLHGAAVPPPRIAHAAVIIPREPPESPGPHCQGAESSHSKPDRPCSSCKAEEDVHWASLTETLSNKAEEDILWNPSRKAACKSNARGTSGDREEERERPREKEEEVADILLSLLQSEGESKKVDFTAEAMDLALVLSSLSVSDHSVTGRSGDGSGDGDGDAVAMPSVGESGGGGISHGWRMLAFGGATAEHELNDIVIWDPHAQGCAPGDHESTVELHLQEI